MTNKTSAKNRSFKGESSFRAIAELVCIVNRAKSQREIDNAGRQLLDLARFAHLTREEQICTDASKLVLHVPVSHGLHLAADYYRVISQEELVGDRDALVRVAYGAPFEYRARVIHHIGYGYEIEGDIAEAARYYIEAAAVANDQDCLSRFWALSGLAYLRSEEGDHVGAIAGFEALFPSVSVLSQVYPTLYADHLNNFAVVLSKAGMTKRAERAINAALASPFAARFPEWRETQRGIEEAAHKQPHKRSPAFGILSVMPRPSRAAKESRPRPTKKAVRLLVFTSVRPACTGTVLNVVFPTRSVVSLLERYVKTVRIRDRP
jgi:tetratricopeptide (TPR) repeat protein